MTQEDDELTVRDKNDEWPQPPGEGVYVSSIGRFCCEDCEVVLEPTMDRVDEPTWQPYIWRCPECEEKKQI